MIVFVRILVILFIGMAAAVSATAQDDLDRRIAELEAMQAKSQETIKALRLEVDALGQEIGAVKDAEIQANLPPPDSGSKHQPVFPNLALESQFVLQSQDGAFKLAIDGLLVSRYEFNHRKDDGTGSSDSDQGFANTGARINFRGTLYRDFGYWVRFNADDSGDPFIDAAMGIYYINENATIVFGQFPSLLTRDQGIPVDKIQVQESSPTNYTFDPFGFQGVMLGYHTPRMVFRAIINDGYRSSNNTSFDEASADWAFAGQVSGLVVGDKGDWPRFNNFTSRPGSYFAWLLNGAFQVQQGASNLDPSGDDSDLFLAIAESSMEGDGWNLYNSFFYRYTDPSSDGKRADDFGFVVQGGAWVAKHVEVYSRFDMTIPDSDRPTQDDNFKTVTTGVSFYPFPHTDNIKFSTEFLYMFDAESKSIVEPNQFSSVRAADGDQYVIRAQAHIRW